MPHMIQRLIPLVLAAATLALAGCQPGLSGGGPKAGDAVTPNAVAGEAIEVTVLDALPSAEAEVASGPPELAADPAAEPTDATGLEPTAEAAADAGAPEAEPEVEAEVAPPPAPKSPEALACEKKGGDWSATGLGSLRTCVFPTRDAGKSCTRQSDCEGMCLARSGTCSPIKPLLGCNDILQDNGVRATLCIE